ncbi:MAG: AAA family ATPase [Gammaproteobacteria bacterium AqS3]|nr:AAA family ATPase [Gammaproteobacteria bacterium AqS3]
MPFFHRNSRKISGEVFKARFEYSSEDVLNDDINKHHHLTQQRDSRIEKLDEWKRVPEQEKEHLEENAFKERYIYIQELRRDGDKIPKLNFLLDEDKTSRSDLKTRIDEMWEHSRTLEAVDFKAKAESSGNSSDQQAVNVGYVFDAPEQPRLVIVLKNIRGESPQSHQAGTLVLDGGLADLDYEFCWRSGELFYFAVSRDHDHEFEERHQEISELLQDGESNTEVLIESGINAKGRLHSVKTCFEVVMRDFKDKPGGYPGELYEDVSRETVPLRRQIEAVEDFSRREMVEPGFESVLLNPGGHLPQIVSLDVSDEVNETPEDGYSLFQDDDDWGEGDPDPDSYFSKSTGAKSEGTRLDENQEKAVQGALTQKPIFLIHGPPGTGKTTVIEEIIRRILTGDDRKRILVCSQTNLAVDNVLERLGRSEKSGIRPVRLAADENKIDQPVKPLWLDKSLQSWGKDKINRSNQYFKQLQDRAPEKARKIERILKKYHQFLREAGAPNRKDRCLIRGYDGYGLESFEEAFLRSRNVIGATCVHMAAARYRSLFKGTFDFVIMDEASKATPAESLIPILRAKRAILIGDHKQLPPFVTTDKDVLEKVRADSSEEFEYPDETLRRKYGKSLFEILIENFQKPEQGQLQQMLKVQRRMPKQIGDLISRHFYGGELASDEELDKKKTANPPLRFRRPTSIVFIDTSHHKDRHDNGKSTSRQNRCNARVIEETLKTLNEKLRELGEEKDIAVIAGYRSQVGLLRDRIRRLKPAQKLRQFKGGIEPNTVDGFQGKENDIVIFDVVRSATGGKIGFLDDRRRLNVSLSRARELLIIVGDLEFLSKKAGPIPDPDIPGDKERQKPLLGLIADEIAEQGFVFNSLEEALQ